MIVYDPRARYLTGLLGWPSYDPRARYLTGAEKKRPRIRAANGKGLGDDSSLVQIPYVPTTQVVTAPDGSRWLQVTDAQGNMSSTPIDNGVQPTVATISAPIVVTPSSGVIPPPASQQKPAASGFTAFLNSKSMGVPNGALFLGGGALLLLLAGGKRR